MTDCNYLSLNRFYLSRRTVANMSLQLILLVLRKFV